MKLEIGKEVVAEKKTVYGEVKEVLRGVYEGHDGEGYAKINVSGVTEYRAMNTVKTAEEYAVILAKREDFIRENEEDVECSCGHTVEKSMVMNASLGSCCPECYDRMS